MHHLFKIINASVVFLIVILSGCQSLSPQPPPITALPKATSWSQHQSQVAPFVFWNIKGKLGIKTPDDAHSTLMNWQQQDALYNIQLTTPIGTAVAYIHNDDHQVHLKLSEDEEYSAHSLDELLWQQVGWTLPADQLFYWVRGLPSPAPIEQFTIDDQFRLTQLQQSDWRIEYKNYSSETPVALPTKIIITHPKLKLTLLVSDWQVSTQALP